MNYELCCEFISHLDQDWSLGCGYSPDEVKSWLKTLALPSEFHRFMNFNWPQLDGQIVHISILSAASICAHELTPLLLKYQFWYAGSAPNGDYFVLDLSTEKCTPGFISHEAWEPWNPEPKDPRPTFQQIARTFESFLYRALEGRYLPTDYSAAEAFNTFLAKEQNYGHG